MFIFRCIFVFAALLILSPAFAVEQSAADFSMPVKHVSISNLHAWYNGDEADFIMTERTPAEMLNNSPKTGKAVGGKCRIEANSSSLIIRRTVRIDEGPFKTKQAIYKKTFDSTQECAHVLATVYERAEQNKTVNLTLKNNGDIDLIFN